MAHHDALFQLGMDLAAGSSTAQTEEKHSNVVPLSDPRKDYFCERDGVRFAGQHLIIDVIDGQRLDDLDHMEAAFRKCVEVCGATLLHIHMHHFTPNGGVSGVAVLAESHISVHTWPEASFAAFDVFMCGDARPELAVGVLQEFFSPEKVIVKTHRRGEDAALPELAELHLLDQKTAADAG